MEGKFVTAMACSTLWEAEIVKSLLASEGIPAVLLDSETVNMNWLWSNAVGGVKVQVPLESLDRAREVLSSHLDGDSPEDPITCPRCHNTHIRLQIRGRRWTFLTWLLCGIPLIWPSRRLFCSRCGYRWREDKGDT